jgi:cyclomaltodextrin glucanotransferase
MIRAALFLLAVMALAAPARGNETGDYRARTIYFIVTDRFNAHHPFSPYVDPQHPDATNIVNCFLGGCRQEAEFRKYWGGDLQGVRERLGYVRRLGISALWVTPLMENVRDYELGTGYGTGYHGYWVQNYYRPNAHFAASWNDVDYFSAALHAADIRYIEDITLNDSNPSQSHVLGALYRTRSADLPFIESYLNDYDPAAPGLRYYKHYQSDSRCAHAPPNDADWSYWQLHHCLLAGLSGFNQLDPSVAGYLIGAGQTWIDHGADDFRLDAIKFVFPEFVPEFAHAMIDRLRAERRSDPYLVGEWSNGGVGDAKSLRFANDYAVNRTNILDFKLASALNQFVGGAYEAASQQLSGWGLDRFLQQRVIAFNGRDTWQGTFVDNHDQIRTLVRLQKLGIRSEAERERRLDLALTLLLTVRGIPIVLYGDEQYLAYYADDATPPAEDINTSNDDPYNRVGMLQWNETTPAFRITAKLAALRSSHAAVSRGAYRGIYADRDVLVFERCEGADTVLVAVNRGPAKRIALSGTLGFAPGTYRGLLFDSSSTNRGNVLRVAAGGAQLDLGQLSEFAAQSR